MTIVKILIAGWGILTVAILLNILASRLGIDTWFSFVNEAKKVGFLQALQKESFVELFFQFIAYPLLLGLTAHLILKILR